MKTARTTAIHSPTRHASSLAHLCPLCSAAPCSQPCTALPRSCIADRCHPLDQALSAARTCAGGFNHREARGRWAARIPTFHVPRLAGGPPPLIPSLLLSATGELSQSYNSWSRADLPSQELQPIYIFSVENAVWKDSCRRQCRHNRRLGSLPALSSVRILTGSVLWRENKRAWAPGYCGRSGWTKSRRGFPSFRTRSRVHMW